MVEVLRQMFTYLVSNYALYLVITMGCIVSITMGILTLIKKPIKKLTSKITNIKIRKLANKMFIIFAFVLSALMWFLLNRIAPQYFSIEAVEILLTGAFSIVLYALGDGVITKSSAEQLVDTIIEVSEDKKEEKQEREKTKKKTTSAIQDYLKKVK